MSETRNIVVLGASAAGVQATHYIMKHILPALKAKKDAKYHVYNIAPSAHFYFRIATPRVATSTSLLEPEKIIFDLHESYKIYSKDDLTFIEASATDLNAADRTISYTAKGQKEQQLPYHALIVATGSNTHHPAFSSSYGVDESIASLKATNEAVKTAKNIIISGGGPTAIEFAGEVGEFRNGRPGWFSTPKRQLKITLITADKQLLPILKPSVGATAEKKLSALGVDVQYNTRVVSSAPTADGRTAVTLADGSILETDLYVPAWGVVPNSSFLPADLKDAKGYLKTNEQTLRVDLAGPRVYALGDISTYSKNNAMSIINGLPVLAVNLKRDLLAFSGEKPDAKPAGSDRILGPQDAIAMIVPVGMQGGVGQLFGFAAPSWLVWLVKGRDYLLGMSGIPTASGKSVAKEFKMTAAEAAY